MSNPLADAAIKSGLIPAESLAEMQRWRAPIEIPEEIPEPPKDVEEAAEKIRNVLESQGYVLTKETDLNILQQYLSTQKSGKLHVEVPQEAGEELATTTADFDVVYGKTLNGEYIFPWRGESLRDEMTNGLTYLEVVEHPAFPNRVFFSDLREVFYGDVKAFIVCTLASVQIMVETNNV